MEKILILLATYNGEKYLLQQIESLLKQKNVEVFILVRDDGSTDKTKEILKHFSNDKLKWYQGNHINVQKGYLELMNEAAKTNFNYFAFCDQDDIWDLDKLDVAISRLKQENSSIPLLYYCGQRLVDDKLNFLANHKLKKNRTDYARFLLNDAAGCTEVFNRKLLDMIVSYEPDYILMHDAWILKVCLATGGHILVDEETHISYRQHGQNVVGLHQDLKSKLNRAKQYIFQQKVEPQMRELYTGFKKDLAEEYSQIIEDVLSYKNSYKSKYRLLDKNKFNFDDVGLQITYYIKVLLNRL